MCVFVYMQCMEDMGSEAHTEQRATAVERGFGALSLFKFHKRNARVVVGIAQQADLRDRACTHGHLLQRHEVHMELLQQQQQR